MRLKITYKFELKGVEMKILFTAKGKSWEDLVDPRFGRAEMFVVYDEDKDALTVISNDEAKQKAHGVGLQSAKKALEAGVDAIITGNGAGEKALEILEKSNIKVYVGAGEVTLENAYKAFKEGRLQLQF